MESFSLTWKEYQNVATGLFSNLSNDKDFADVTLVCTDNKQVQSHKVILNAGSSLFKEILSTNFQRKHALIYLKGVDSAILLKILDFIYKGQTDVDQENLEAFLEVAKDLRIKGLYEEQYDVDEPSIEKENVASESEETKEDIVENVKSEHLETEEEKQKDQDDRNITKGETVERRRSIQEKPFSCSRCNGTYTNETTLKRHLLSVHEGVKQPWPQCEKQFSTLDSLKRHTKSTHDGIRYECKKCSNSFTSTSAIKRHEDAKHPRVD